MTKMGWLVCLACVEVVSWSLVLWWVEWDVVTRLYSAFPFTPAMPSPSSPQIADVRVSHHAATSPDYSIATYHQYSMFTDAGAMILHNESYFETNPQKLCTAELQPLVEQNRRHIEWISLEQTWRKQPLTRVCIGLWAE